MFVEMSESKWEQQLIDYFSYSHEDYGDASHDIGHFRRVYHTAKEIAAMDFPSADPLVLLAAAYLHDLVSLPKDHPDNKMSSRYAAVKAKYLLQNIHFPREKIAAVCHAIEAHSFSAQLFLIQSKQKSSKMQDRMESLGALGVMRTFYVSGRLGIEPFDKNDLYAHKRPLDDKLFGLDHFYLKLFKLPALLQTEAWKASFGETSILFLHDFVKELEQNIHQGNGEALALVDICCQAGREGIKLFESVDPLGLKRPLAPKRYVIDKLIALRKKHPASSISS